MNNEFPPARKQGVYDAIVGRRDVRAFLPDPVSDEVLGRLLVAAHHGPSVGFMQPWNFLVIRDPALRARIRAHVDEERIEAAKAFTGERREKYLTLKLEGILEAPLNLCVTCDPNRAGPAVIGRNTIRETDLYSTCCAVQNLWLAARAEGLGVGWVSILKPGHLRTLLDIPDHVIPVAYLCIGHVAGFPDRPLLESLGWLARLPLSDLVFRDRWGLAPTTPLRASLEKGLPTPEKTDEDA